MATEIRLHSMGPSYIYVNNLLQGKSDGAAVSYSLAFVGPCCTRLLITLPVTNLTYISPKTNHYDVLWYD